VLDELVVEDLCFQSMSCYSVSSLMRSLP
jgi:hypothetical protein